MMFLLQAPGEAIKQLKSMKTKLLRHHVIGHQQVLKMHHDDGIMRSQALLHEPQLAQGLLGQPHLSRTALHDNALLAPCTKLSQAIAENAASQRQTKRT